MTQQTLLRMNNWLNLQRKKEQGLDREGSKIYFAVKTHLAKAEQALNDARDIEFESCVIENTPTPRVYGQEEMVLEIDNSNNYWHKIAKAIIP